MGGGGVSDLKTYHAHRICGCKDRHKITDWPVSTKLKFQTSKKNILSCFKNTFSIRTYKIIPLHTVREKIPINTHNIQYIWVVTNCSLVVYEKGALWHLVRHGGRCGWRTHPSAPWTEPSLFVACSHVFKWKVVCNCFEIYNQYSCHISLSLRSHTFSLHIPSCITHAVHK